MTESYLRNKKTTALNQQYLNKKEIHIKKEFLNTKRKRIYIAKHINKNEAKETYFRLVVCYKDLIEDYNDIVNLAQWNTYTTPLTHLKKTILECIHSQFSLGGIGNISTYVCNSVFHYKNTVKYLTNQGNQIIFKRKISNVYDVGHLILMIAYLSYDVDKRIKSIIQTLQSIAENHPDVKIKNFCLQLMNDI